MPLPLSEQDIQTELKALDGWSYDNHKITKKFVFQHFREAIGFIVRLSYEAEQRDHHPEIFNVYNQVTLSLQTHDAGNQVTAKDIDLAKSIETFNWL